MRRTATQIVIAALVLGGAGCKDSPGRNRSGPAPLRAAQPRVLPPAASGPATSRSATSAAIPTAATSASSGAPDVVPALADPMAQAAYMGSWTVSDAAGQQLVQLTLASEMATVRYGDHTLSSTLRTGSRRYQLDGADGYLAKVKRRGPQIRLHSRTLTAPWSATLALGQVTIEHPEGTRYLIRRDEAEVLVERDGKTLGRARHDAASGQVQVRDAKGALRFQGEAERATAFWLLPLLSDIPETQRYILMAELAARGR